MCLICNKGKEYFRKCEKENLPLTYEWQKDRVVREVIARKIWRIIYVGKKTNKERFAQYEELSITSMAGTEIIIRL